VNPPNPASSHRFLCKVQDKTVGPFDLIELAAEFRYDHIDAETPICREGTEDWLAFRDLPEFATVQAISIDAIARHLEKKERASQLSGTATSLPWLVVGIALFFLALVALVSISQPSKTADTPQVADQPIPSFAFARQYRAEMNITNRAGQTTSTVYKDNGKERLEFTAKGHPMVFIIRPDLMRSYTIWTDYKFVTQDVLDTEEYKDTVSKSATGPDAKIEGIDREDFQGVPCLKYKVTTDKHTWSLWVDAAKQIPLSLQKEDGDSSVEYGTDSSIQYDSDSSIQFKSYQVGPQDPSLFEAPTDYTWR